MTKRQLIDRIVTINRSAEPGFLAQFEDDELNDYLRHLHVAQSPRPHADPRRFARYFELPESVATTVEDEEPQQDIFLPPEEDVPAEESDEEPDEELEEDQDEPIDLEELKIDLDDEEIDNADPEPTVAVAATAENRADSPFAEEESEETEAWLF